MALERTVINKKNKKEEHFKEWLNSKIKKSENNIDNIAQLILTNKKTNAIEKHEAETIKKHENNAIKKIVKETYTGLSIDYRNDDFQKRKNKLNLLEQIKDIHVRPWANNISFSSILAWTDHYKTYYYGRKTIKMSWNEIPTYPSVLSLGKILNLMGVKIVELHIAEQEKPDEKNIYTLEAFAKSLKNANITCRGYFNLKYLSQYEYDEKQIEKLGNDLKTAGVDFVEFELSYKRLTQLTDKQLIVLSDCLKKLRVNSLHINCNYNMKQLTDTDYQKIGENLFSLGVPAVNFSANFVNQLATEEVKMLGEKILNESVIRSVNLSLNHLFSSHNHELLKALGFALKMGNIQSVNLSENHVLTHYKQFDETGIAALGEAIKMSDVSFVDLSHNNLYPEQLLQLLTILKSSKVTKIDFSGNCDRYVYKFTDQQWDRFCTELSSSDMKDVIFGDDELTTDQRKKLIEALISNTERLIKKHGKTIHGKIPSLFWNHNQSGSKKPDDDNNGSLNKRLR